MRYIFGIALAATLSSAGLAQAQDSGSFGIGLGFSSLGAQLEGSYRFSPQFGARAIVAGVGSYDDTVSEGDYDVDAETSWSSFGLIGDYYVPGSNFRLSAGLVRSNLDFSGVASSDTPFDIGGTTYAADTEITVDGEFGRSTAPILAVGYVGMVGNWSLSGEIGGMFVDGIDVSGRQTAGTDSVDQADIDREIDDVTEDLDFGVYPYIGLNATFRF